jgi:hypothetical protein
MSFLKRATDKVGKLIIKDLLHAKVGGNEPARGQDTIHASDLTKQNNQWGVGYCPREVRLREVVKDAPKRPPQFLPVATYVTFNEGRDKQKRLNEDWLVDIMWGRWVCLACGEEHKFSLRPESSGGDHLHVWQYEEPRVIDYISKTSGGIDAVVDVGKKKLHIIEVKIMKSDDFKALVAPLSEHRVRTRLYLRQIAGSRQKFAKKIETDYAHILYIMRGHGCKQEDGRISPFKEYIVERDDSEVQHYLGMAHALTLSRQDDKLFPAGVCANQMEPRAVKCPLAKTCFSTKFTGNISWLHGGVPPAHHVGNENIIGITDGEELHECISSGGSGTSGTSEN